MLKRLFKKILFVLSPMLSDESYVKLQYLISMGKILNLKHPRTFNEKIQWLKLYDRHPEYTKMVDKLAAKEYVAGIIGKDYIIPTLAVYNSAEDIDFNALPNQFVLKCTHDSGRVVVCRDKSKIDIANVRKIMRKDLNRSYYLKNREYPYKDVPRRIIAEQYMEDTIKPSQTMVEYKFYCFDGEPKYCQVIQNRNTEDIIDFFDMEWQHQEFVGINPMVGSAARCPRKPKNFALMKRIVCDLPKGKLFSRVDLYEENENTYFGEIILYPASKYSVCTQDGNKDIPEHQIIHNINEMHLKSFLSNFTGLHQNDGKYEITIDSETTYYYKEINSELKDYKFFCFNGEPKVLFVASDRGRKDTETKFDFFDMKWNHLPFTNGHPNSNVLPEKPKNFEEMIIIAKRLSQGFPHVRIDLYNVSGKIYFGEITFYHWSGMVPFEPEEWDDRLGDYITLPS